MAGWISSKLKVAETLLQQIDQQAAESLRKGEHKHQNDDALNDVVSSSKTATTGNGNGNGNPPLRDQLLNKNKNNKPTSTIPIPTPINITQFKTTSTSAGVGIAVGVGDSVIGNKDDDKSKDIDWTELLNTPQPKQPSINRPRGNVMPIPNVVRKARSPNVDTPPGAPRAEVSKSDLERNVDGIGSSTMGIAGQSLGSDVSALKLDSPSEGVSHVVSDQGKRGVVVEDGIGGGSTFGIDNRNGDVVKDVLGGLKNSSRSASDQDSDSDSGSGSGSSSDSGGEREREERRQRRRQILAAKAAAKAADAIKEQENVVARLEGEKQSLQKILEDQANQAAQEASELQSVMMEMMEATELEKQKHNHTRMKVLERLAKLETANADLAKSLATAQWNLEIEVNHLAELRQQVDIKQIVLEELRRKIYGAHQTRATSTHLMASKGIELQKEMLEAECAFTTDKIARLQKKEMKLEESIDMTLKEMENPTEVEVELRRRLRQMTDHLIQKQAMVESLSSEKATLLFRIEAVSRLLDENKSLINGDDISGCSRDDLESATWESTGSKLRPMLENKIQSGRQHLGSLVRQLDAIFSDGAVFLARNPAAKVWSLVYLVSLHLWVLYILFSHSRSTEESTSSSVLSLENINGSIGV